MKRKRCMSCQRNGTRDNGHPGNHPRVAVTDGAVELEHALPQLAGWLGLVQISLHAGQA